jgi:hypothetical protein
MLNLVGSTGKGQMSSAPVTAVSPSSNGVGGPAIPSDAMIAANTPFRAAFAAAQPFHVVRWPRRLMSVPRLGTAASAMVWAVCCKDSPSTLAAPAALATAL